jgi:hypothetical protein
LCPGHGNALYGLASEQPPCQTRPGVGVCWPPPDEGTPCESNLAGIESVAVNGIEAPNILHTNTLTENVADIQEKDRYDVVLANPPFGGHERKEVQQNFPIRNGETAFLFLQHFIKIVKAGGRGGIVIKNTFLSNTDNAAVSLRKLLLESCNLHTVLDCPGGTFRGAGVKTVVRFLRRAARRARSGSINSTPVGPSVRPIRSTMTTSSSS